MTKNNIQIQNKIEKNIKKSNPPFSPDMKLKKIKFNETNHENWNKNQLIQLQK